MVLFLYLMFVLPTSIFWVACPSGIAVFMGILGLPSTVGNRAAQPRMDITKITIAVDIITIKISIMFILITILYHHGF